ncbi:tumor necrosis factor alpha-induced protein 2 isoform X1 [Silurus meridionalis]|nr:tumor necrosis factor alpha-induced protein 2 isoform X1 [Silurus meridionalis]
MACFLHCRKLLDCFSSRQRDGGAMTVGSASPIDKKLSKSRFSKLKANLPFFRRNSHVHAHTHVDQNPSEVLLTFQQNLEQNQFSVAGKQLICREERLFALKQEGVESNKCMLEEEEEDAEEKLKQNFKDLLTKVMSTVERSLDVQTNEEKEFLKEAILAIDQEEEQDRRWDGVGENERPPWRPRCCRQDHDRLIQDMVIQRMEKAQLDSNVNITSSIKKEITAKAKQLKEDLLKIVRNVRSCYPNENVCQLYAELYHQLFSASLMEIAKFGIVDDDCIYVLQWVNSLYPQILKYNELSEVIKHEDLKPVLPDDVLEPLEKQFLFSKESELQTLCQTVINREKNYIPELRDDCYISHLATDIIQCVNALLKLSRDVLGSWSKTQRITHPIKQFLINYHHFLEKVIEENQANADATLKANLQCILELRNYIMMNLEPFPQDIRNDCIDILDQTRDTCHRYFTNPIQKDLKWLYFKLGTKEWLKDNEYVCGELLKGVQRHIDEIRLLNEASFKDLVSKLHEQVLAEYVRKMMKKKTRFKDQQKQKLAAERLVTNSQKIHTLFTEAGSNMKGLEKILPSLAELLTIQDPHCIVLHLATLSKTYPDLSEAHVSAWLYLKATLSASDLKDIKKTFAICNAQNLESAVDGKEPLYSSRSFFSKVVIR